MSWNIFLFVMPVIYIGGIICAFLPGITKNKNKRFWNITKILTICTFLSSVVMFIPIYDEMISSDLHGFFRLSEVLLLSVHNTIRLFIVDGEFNIILDHMEDLDKWVSTIYSFFAAMIFVAAPVLTFSVVLSFFKSVLT